MNEQSLQRVNAFLAAASRRAQVGELVRATPAALGKDAGFDDPLAAARAVRALIARKRLEAVDDGYRLLETRPVAPDEPEAIPRPPRRRKETADAGDGARSPGKVGTTTYSEIGRSVIDRLIELANEVGETRGAARASREEARDLRQDRDDAERRARELAARVKDLEGKLEMAEENLRTLLTAAQGTERDSSEPVGDSEMAAILGVLKG